MPSSDNSNWGCLALGVLSVCALIVVGMILGTITKAIGDTIRKDPGVIFIAAIIIGFFAFGYLYDKSKQ